MIKNTNTSKISPKGEDGKGTQRTNVTRGVFSSSLKKVQKNGVLKRWEDGKALPSNNNNANNINIINDTEEVPHSSHHRLSAFNNILTSNNPQSPDNLYTFSLSTHKFVNIQIQQSFIIFHNQTQVKIINEEEWEEKKNDPELEFETNSDEDNKTRQKLVLRNKFNISDLGSQTVLFNKNKCVETDPPLKERFLGTVSQYEIYRSYLQETSPDMEEKANQLVLNHSIWLSASFHIQPFSKKMIEALTIMERLVNQNIESNVFKRLFINAITNEEALLWHVLWRVPNTENAVATHNSYLYRNNSGINTYNNNNIHAHNNNAITNINNQIIDNLSYPQSNVTALEWNPIYRDLFAVALGSYPFDESSLGAICCYSLKNMRHAEHYYELPCTVCNIAWHTTISSILAASLFDGNIYIFDFRLNLSPLLCTNPVNTLKYKQPIWDVKWGAEDSSLSFILHTISENGKMTNWILKKNKLQLDEEIGYNSNDYISNKIDLPDGHLFRCFDFHPTQKDIYIVGTEEGALYKCSLLYGSQFLETYKGHNMLIYCVHWNPLCSYIFLSASADWTVRIWDDRNKSTLMIFDLLQPIGDAIWAPKSSTVFVVTLSDGSIFLFDLLQNYYDKITSFKVTKKVKLTKISFNFWLPILIVGDEQGFIHCLKLPHNILSSLNEVEDSATKDALLKKETHVWKIQEFIEKISPLYSDLLLSEENNNVI